MRSIVAHVYRLVAADLRPTTLQEDAPLRIKITDWIIDTLKYLQAGIAGQLCQAALLTLTVCTPTHHAHLQCVTYLLACCHLVHCNNQQQAGVCRIAVQKLIC